MGYVESNLMPNEKVLLRASVHPIVFLPSLSLFAIGILLALPALATSQPSPEATEATISSLATILCCASFLFFISAVQAGVQALVYILTTEFAVTNRRIIAKQGFIRRHTLEMMLDKVESVSVDQGILGRLLNFGTITVIGTGGTRQSFRAIAAPLRMRQKIYRVIEQLATVPPSRNIEA
ncbi:PH domain-containing protein [Thermoflexus sp.]|uniref:PH domain-containing protein n=1 Tax=Thermoflexus sp. TaxID=1969742 RepID=UPI002ADE5287|nr:PH domain-containing protein [Thermoflexus sp.]